MKNSNNDDPIVSTTASNPTSDGSAPPASSDDVTRNGNSILSTLPHAPGLPHPSVTAAASVATPIDDICTILVVGFPEDMQEREFLNMFTFCPGFEAAMLKAPTVPNQEESTTTATPIAAVPTTTSLTTTDTDTDTATDTKDTGSPSHSPPSSANNNLTAGASKKLRIGVAKFRNRLFALEARNVLNGRRVDPQSNAVLKAELAKKNLHMTRRSMTANNSFELSPMVAGPQSAGVSSRIGLGFSTLPADRSTSSTALNSSQRFQSTTTSEPAAFNAFYSVPSTPSALGNEMMRKDYSSSNNSYDFSIDSSRFPLSDPPTVRGSSRSLSVSHPSLSMHRLGSNGGQDSLTGSSSFGSSADPPNSASGSRSGENFPVISRSNSTSAAGRTFFGREISTRSMTVGGGASEHIHTGNMMARSPFGGGHSSINNVPNEDQLGPLSARISQLSINTQLSGLYGAGAPNLGPLSAPAITAPRNPIPADQNPRCNTLYVGNLPVDTQEDELRRLFSTQHGYKRLCFRPKPGTGPMCFVEFDDVACAAHAMNELHGKLLSNSVKGGIRLSYSKNPLGVRQTPMQQQQQQQQQQLQQLRQAHLAQSLQAPADIHNNWRR